MSDSIDTIGSDHLFHDSPVPMWICAKGDLAFLAVNEAAIARYGYSRDEFLKMRATDIRPTEDVPALLQRLSDRPSGTDHAGVWRHRTKGGDLLHVDVVTHELTYLGHEAHLVVVHDVSDRVRTARTLEKHVAVLEAVGFAASLLLSSAEWGPAVARILEHLGSATNVSRAYLFTVDDSTTSDVIFTQQYEWAAEHARPEIANPTMQRMSFEESGFADWIPVFRAGMPVFGPVTSFSDKARDFLSSQDIRTVLCVPIFVEGELWGFMGFDECRHVRRWEEAEVGALRTAAHIIGMGVQRSLLEHQFLQSQKMEVVGFLASGIAHDFNNALAVIFASCDFLSLRLGDEHPVSEDVREIRRAAERGSALTRQLLGFSRDQRIAPRDIDVNETIANLSRMIQRLLGENISIELLLSPRAGVVHMDPSQLEQVLVNLAVNARDAMPSGGKLILSTACEPPPSATQCSSERSEGNVVIRVADTGEGIAPGLLDRIFEPFFTTKPTGKGTGLGLAMVQRAIATAGGRIGLESVVGKGTTFTLYLPRRRRPQLAEAAAIAATGSGHRETILVVEDDEPVRRAMVRMLSEANYKPVEASNGDQALELLTALEAEVRLLVTDVLMPGMSGVELARQARARFPGIKVLLCSGHADEALDVAGFEGEVLRLLRKPFDRDTLLERVAELIAS